MRPTYDVVKNLVGQEILFKRDYQESYVKGKLIVEHTSDNFDGLKATYYLLGNNCDYDGSKPENKLLMQGYKFSWWIGECVRGDYGSGYQTAFDIIPISRTIGEL